MENTATNKLVGTKIKELRVLDGLTQKQLADELSISDKHLSKIENGQKTPAYFFAGKDIADETDANRAINAIVEDLKVATISDLKVISKVVKDIIYK